MEPKIFTMQETDRLLPQLNGSFARIFYLNERIKTISKDMQELMDIWSEQILEHDNPDNKFYFEKLRDREDAMHELQKLITDIHKSGCIIKDVNEGLVDFYCKRSDDLIFLCWKYGEEKIRFWHSLEGGFSGRRSVEELVHVSEKQI